MFRVGLLRKLYFKALLFSLFNEAGEVFLKGRQVNIRKGLRYGATG